MTRRTPSLLSSGVRLSAIAIACTLLPLAVAPAFGQALILTDSFRGAVVEAATALEEITLALGLAPETREPVFGEDLGDLTAYRCVFDLRVDHPLTSDEETRLRDYAAYGGGLFFSGEHSVFDPRNSSITGFLISLAAGGVLTDASGVPPVLPADYPEEVNALHPLATQCDTVTEVVYDGVDNGSFLDVGFGTWLTQDVATGDIGAAVWDMGTMFFAPAARVVVMLDINGMATSVGTGTLDYRIDGVTPTQNRILVQNIVDYLCYLKCCPPGQWPPFPPPTPEPFALDPLDPARPMAPASPDSTCLPGSPLSASIRLAPPAEFRSAEPGEPRLRPNAEALAAAADAAARLEHLAPAPMPQP